ADAALSRGGRRRQPFVDAAVAVVVGAVADLALRRDLSLARAPRAALAALGPRGAAAYAERPVCSAVARALFAARAERGVGAHVGARVVRARIVRARVVRARVAAGGV